ncbi:MAG: HAD family hydrolase [Anaerolineales bacterium]|nr:HAD family hydrolase [Anaerolineales bacterium]
MIDTILFDLDDTLVAFDAVTEISWIQVCNEYANETGLISSERLRQTIEKHSNHYWSDEVRHRIGRQDIVGTRRKLVSLAFDDLMLPKEAAFLVADNYSRVRLDNMYLFPGTIEILSHLVSKNMKLALVTNGDSEGQREKIDRFDLEKYFDAILIEGEMGFGKPDERVFIKALEILNATPERTLMVGDNLKWDVGGPQALGIRGIWYDRKSKGLPENSTIKPDRIISNINHLVEILIELNSSSVSTLAHQSEQERLV